MDPHCQTRFQVIAFSNKAVPKSIPSITAAESIRRPHTTIKKSKKSSKLPLTADIYPLWSSVYPPSFQSGQFFNYTSVSSFFFVLGNTKDSFGSQSLRFGSTYFICSTPINLCLTKKKISQGEHVPSITLGTSNAPHWNQWISLPRTEPLSLPQQPPPTYPIWCHNFFLIVFFFYSVLVVS